MKSTTVKLDAAQIERIIDKVVPLIADPQDHEFFRGILFIKAENSTSAAFAAFVGTLLE